jgi:hypothetical protein
MSSKKISNRPQKTYYCSEDHKKNIAKTASALGVSESDVCVLAIELFLKKSFREQLLDFAAWWESRANELPPGENDAL